MTIVLAWVLATLAVERMTEIIHSGEIFETPRHWILQKDNFFSALLGCGFCLSFWVAATVAWGLPGEIIASCAVMDIVVKTFALGGLANIAHEFLSRWFGQIPIILAFQRVEVIDEKGRSRKE